MRPRNFTLRCPVRGAEPAQRASSICIRVYPERVFYVNHTMVEDRPVAAAVMSKYCVGAAWLIILTRRDIAMHVCMYIYNICMYMYAYLPLYIYIYICMQPCAYIHVCTWAYTYTYTYTYTYIYVCVCVIHVYIYIHTNPL